MRAIEKDNESLKGVLPKDYARPALNKVMLGELRIKDADKFTGAIA
jgi:type I restriction enzyme M protein